MSEVEQNKIDIPELNDLRVTLDQMTERITSRLKDRSRFEVNPDIYAPGAVAIVDRNGISLVEFALEGLEAYHASLGRFDDGDQYPVFGRNLPPASVAGQPTRDESILRDDLSSAGDLIPFYQGLVEDHCEPGDSPEHHGETAYIDADLIQMMHERINVGRRVAEIKGRQDATLYECETDEEIESKLRDEVREAKLLTKVAGIAERYDLEPSFATDAFEWIIAKTIQLEIEYVHAKVAQRA